MGSQGPLAHVAPCSALWHRWRLLGDSVAVQWVPSHVGAHGNEHADAGAVKGSAHAYPRVPRDREVTDMWRDLGLEEMEEKSLVAIM